MLVVAFCLFMLSLVVERSWLMKHLHTVFQERTILHYSLAEHVGRSSGLFNSVVIISPAKQVLNVLSIVNY
jgi:hypothetical protein